MGITRRVVVLQRFIPHYRVALFKALTDRFESLGVDLTVLHFGMTGEAPDLPAARRLAGLAVPIRVAGMPETVMVPWGLGRALRSASPAVVVLEGLSGFPMSLVAAAGCRRMAVPYLIWGLGRIPGKRPSALRRVAARAIERFHRGASGFIAYSTHAAGVYEQFGAPCQVALNTSLRRPTETEAEETRAAVRRREASRELRVVCIGRLEPHKRVDVLVDSVRLLRDVPVRLAIVGDGSSRASLERRVRDLGLESRIDFHGAIYNPPDKRALLASSDVGVLPGRGGLAIQELMWHGLPVIGGPADGTEGDLLAPDRGWLIPREPTAQDLADTLRRFGQASLGVRREMAMNALDFVIRVANVENTADLYVEAVKRQLDPTPAERAGRRA